MADSQETLRDSVVEVTNIQESEGVFEGANWLNSILQRSPVALIQHKVSNTDLENHFQTGL